MATDEALSIPQAPRSMRGVGLGARASHALQRDPFAIAAEMFENTDASIYYNDPVRFADECINWPAGQGLTSYQRRALAQLVVDKRVAIRGPHGLGKTTTNAIAVLWFALTRDALGIDWKVATTAGTWRQLEKFLWPEVRKWAMRLNWARLGRKPFNEHSELLKLSLTLRYGQAYAVASSDPAKIEGAHADSVLYIFDEAKIISADTFDAAEGAFSGAGETGLPEAFGLAQSTPGEPNGRFYEIHNRKPGLTDWAAIHVTVQEAIAEGRVSRSWVAARKLQWGELTAVYQNRVLGNFWTSDEDTVIPLTWLEQANERWRDWAAAGRPTQVGQLVVGVDVARGGADKTVLAKRRGAVVMELTSYSVADTMRVADHVQAAMGNPTDLAVVDVIGLGAGVVDQLRRRHRQVIAFNASRKTKMRDRSGMFGFLNSRSAMWWTLRQLLDPAFGATLAIPPDDQLTGDLTAPKWWVTGANVIAIEGKDDIRKRIGRSPDRGDAVGHCVMTNRTFDESSAKRPEPLHEFAEPSEDAEGAFSWS